MLEVSAERADWPAMHKCLRDWAEANRVWLDLSSGPKHSEWEPLEEDDEGYRSVVHIGEGEWDACERNVYILAHELGHHSSFDKLGTLLDKDVMERFWAGTATFEERASVLTEEEIAWAFARALLVQAGLCNLGAFEQQRAVSLDGYRNATLELAREVRDAGRACK